MSLIRWRIFSLGGTLLMVWGYFLPSWADSGSLFSQLQLMPLTSYKTIRTLPTTRGFIHGENDTLSAAIQRKAA